jgi:hypothetical protein
MMIPLTLEEFDNQQQIVLQLSREIALIKNRDQLNSLISSSEINQRLKAKKVICNRRFANGLIWDFNKS